jgi:hypothetical protein
MGSHSSYQQRRRKKRGIAGEVIAEKQLFACGVRVIQPIETGWRVIKWLPHLGNRVAKVVPFKKVAGDLRGVIPGGRSVLVEVKVRAKGKLSWGDFRDHQRTHLEWHSNYGGLSLVAWVEDTTNEVYLLEWPISGFQKYHPLKPEQARELDITDWLMRYTKEMSK